VYDSKGKLISYMGSAQGHRLRRVGGKAKCDCGDVFVMETMEDYARHVKEKEKRLNELREEALSHRDEARESDRKEI
jgi:hypothetical protein